MPTVGRAVNLISDDSYDIAVTIRGRHYRIRESDARRLIHGCRETDLYSLTGHTRHGSISTLREYYRVKTIDRPAYCNINRLSLLIQGIYYYAPVDSFCRDCIGVRI